MQSEYQKMISGQLYDPADPKLKQDRITAQDLCFELAQLKPSRLAERILLLKQLFRREQDDFHIEMPFRCDYGYNISLGKHFYANYNCTMLDCAKITIGDNVMFAPNVSLFTATHPIDAEKRNSGIEFAMPITIGNNVWIGGNSVVMPNVTIGNNVVIGAGSVVTKDIPDNCIAVGNPCRVLREIDERDNIFYFKEKRFE
ncbi:sugar O-acetyltransferase [Glaesserella sp.]|uniref:sugar O-acetyltransferase n=1 Tax=Glaesserella sp. TaxID=2094731 RepID=UPI00359F1C28